MATVIDTWADEVLAFFDIRATNAATESDINVKIKDVRRAARGFRNEAYRARIRLHAGQSRSVPDHHEDQALHPHHRP